MFCFQSVSVVGSKNVTFATVEQVFTGLRAGFQYTFSVSDTNGFCIVCCYFFIVFSVMIINMFAWITR